MRSDSSLGIAGVLMSFSGLRWTSRDGGAEDFVVAHGNPRPDPAPLIVVAVMLSRYDDEGSWVDIHDTLGTILTPSERSRNDPAFQHESRDQAVIERALNAVPGREAWRPFEIEVDGTRRGFERQDVGGDWIAVHNLGDEYLYVHAQHAGSEVISVETIADITPYVAGNRRIGPLS